MKDLQHLWQEVIEQSNDHDREILEFFLTGLQKKQQGDYHTYLAGGLHMNHIVTDDCCTVTIPIHSFIHNTLQLPHGGIIATIADTAMGILANHHVEDGFKVVTTNLQLHYVATAKEGNLVAIARFIHKGRQTMVLEASIEQEDGKQIALATGSFFVIRPRT